MPHPSIIIEEPVLLGDSVRLFAHVRDFAGGLTDPASAGFIVMEDDAAHTLVENIAPTQVSTGQYQADWQVPPTLVPGFYWVEFFGVISGLINRKRAKFQIVFG